MVRHILQVLTVAVALPSLKEEILAINSLGEEYHASPALSADRVYNRIANALYHLANRSVLGKGTRGFLPPCN